MNLLTINGINFDDFVLTKSYSVQKVNEYGGTEYQDGWWKKHRTVVRTRISGTCTLTFTNADDYSTLVQTLDKYDEHNVWLYVNSTNKRANIRAYISYTTKTAISTPVFGQKPVFWSVELTIEER